MPYVGQIWESHPGRLSFDSLHLRNSRQWQKCFLYCSSPGEIDVPHLSGATDYGENVGDLWFITYILKRLTLEIKGLVVKYVCTIYAGTNIAVGT